MAVTVTWQQALAWRMQRHLLEPIGSLPVAGVVRRLCGVQAQVASSAELAVRVRREGSRRGEVGRALPPSERRTEGVARPLAKILCLEQP
jgi:hypothetical protein